MAEQKSKSLSPDQKRYANDRIRNRLNQIEQELRPKFTKMLNKKKTNQQKLEAIRRGDCTLRRLANINDRLIDAFELDDTVEETEFNNEAFDKAMKPFRNQAQAAKDEVMLGQAEKALALVKGFCEE